MRVPGDKGDVATAKAAMDNCLDSDPYTDPYTDAYTDGPADVCSCLQYFEAYEAALETCGEDPSAAYEDTFEGACDDNDNDDDGGNNEECECHGCRVCSRMFTAGATQQR